MSTATKSKNNRHHGFSDNADSESFVDMNGFGKSKETLEKERIEAIIDEARVEFNCEEKQPQTVLSISGVSTCSLGDFSLILGKAKSKKTFAVIMMIAALASGQSINNITASFPESRKTCIWFDTEQSRYHVQKALRRAMRLANLRGAYNLEVYSLRRYNRTDRQAVISAVIHQRNDVCFVVIDGIRDLVHDINNPEQATDLADWLLNITDVNNIHVCTVLHQNKGDGNARGHVGAELVNKSQTTIIIERDPNDASISTVKAGEMRDKEFEPFAFKINDEGLPVIIGDYTPSELNTNKTKKSFDQTIDLHKKIASQIFEFTSAYSFRKLIIQIKLAFEAINQKVSEPTAREYLQHWENQSIIKDISNDSKKQKQYVLLPGV